MFLLEEGASVQQIDKALTTSHAMRIFAVGDLAGLDIGYAIRSAATGKSRMCAIRASPDRVVELGRLARRRPRLVSLRAGDRTPLADPEIEALVDAYRKNSASRTADLRRGDRAALHLRW